MQLASGILDWSSGERMETQLQIWGIIKIKVAYEAIKVNENASGEHFKLFGCSSPFPSIPTVSRNIPTNKQTYQIYSFIIIVCFQ